MKNSLLIFPLLISSSLLIAGGDKLINQNTNARVGNIEPATLEVLVQAQKSVRELKLLISQNQTAINHEENKRIVDCFLEKCRTPLCEITKSLNTLNHSTQEKLLQKGYLDLYYKQLRDLEIIESFAKTDPDLLAYAIESGLFDGSKN